MHAIAAHARSPWLSDRPLHSLPHTPDSHTTLSIPPEPGPHARSA